ncbi:MAG TPA: divalent-cation tolerance protein CutA [Streptosporangiaceae bacterium]|jgi:periplasmic divalent cation tolerance protein
MADYVQVSTTAENRDAAMGLARSAVRAKLAASGQVLGPVVSVFWHAGQYGEGEEWQVWLKTTAGQYPALEAHLKASHEWGNPEITAVPIVAGSAPYLEWVGQTVAAQA